jgi:hypothetical protein
MVSQAGNNGVISLQVDGRGGVHLDF